MEVRDSFQSMVLMLLVLVAGLWGCNENVESDPDTEAPTVPINLSATAITSSQIDLSWTASTDNVGVIGYNIYRDTVHLGTSATNSYSDTGLQLETTYTYSVSAYDAVPNTSEQSSSASAVTYTFDFFPAFPGAEGMGAHSVGGRGGQVIKVTNLNDDGEGSFREAVTASGPRIVVFEVSGYINLVTVVEIRDPYITIAGQTSPGGICITGRPVRILSNDVIITHMRFRLGSHRCSEDGTCENQGETLYVGNGHNIIVDHCSFSWGTDETVQVGSYWGDVYNVTFSWCMICEGLQDPHPEPNHGYGFLVSDKFADVAGPKVSIHHNYIAHHMDRSPQLNGDVLVDFRNNVIYDWYHALGTRIYANALNPQVNVVHNYHKPGINSNACYPDGNAGEISGGFTGTPTEQIFIEGNLGCIRDSQDDDEWCIVKHWSGDLVDRGWQKSAPYAITGIPITTTEMSYNYAQEILLTVGATKPVRDSADTRVVNDFSAGTGDFVDDVTYPDDFPIFQDLPPPTDSDNDGMADDWEIEHGLNTLIDDSALDQDSDGYTNIEEFLFYLTGASDTTP